MPPQRLPGSLTVKEKGWSPSSPRFLLLCTPSFPPSLSCLFPSPNCANPTRLHRLTLPPHQPLPQGPSVRSHLSPIKSFPAAAPDPASRFSALPATLAVFSAGVFVIELFFTHWLRARPHGYRRSCPRDRCVDQPTAGKNYCKVCVWYNHENVILVNVKNR